MGEKRTYRSFMKRRGLTAFTVRHKETDLHIQALRPLEKEVTDWILEARLAIETYGRLHSAFFTSYVPLPDDLLAPPIVRTMLSAGQAADVGPMAAVAGAIAEYVGTRLHQEIGGEVMVENGGDIYLWTEAPVTLAIWAGSSPLTGHIGIRVDRQGEGLGVCTSSGTVGHSKSFGRADAVTVLAPSAPLADAMATSIGNGIQSARDIPTGLQRMQAQPSLFGGLIVVGAKLGAWGGLELVPLENAGPASSESGV